MAHQSRGRIVIHTVKVQHAAAQEVTAADVPGYGHDKFCSMCDSIKST